MSEVVPPDILVGIDTHKHVHAAVAITALAARMGELNFPVNPEGYRQLAAWARSLGRSAPSALRARALIDPAEVILN